LKNVKVSNLKSGDRVGRNIYNQVGQLLIEKNTQISDELLKKIERWNINFIPIYDWATSPIAAPTAVPAAKPDAALKKQLDENLTNAMVPSHQATSLQNGLARGEDIRVETIDKTKKILAHLQLGKKLSRNHSKDTVINLVEEAIDSAEILTTLMSVKEYDNYLFSHSLNVSVLAILTGKALGLNENELHFLGEAALLHDVGMTVVPLSIWYKNTPLTSNERFQVEKHPVFSTDIVETLPHIEMEITQAIYQHHEREDGSGYPRGLTAKRISKYAKVLAVADTYDAMVSVRPFRKRILPHQAMKEIVALANRSLDQETVRAFITHMSLYPAGSVVRLNTKAVGVTVLANRAAPLRPILKMVKNENGTAIADEVFIDLSKDKSLFITEALFDDEVLAKVLIENS